MASEPTCPGCGRPLATEADWEAGEKRDGAVLKGYRPDLCWHLATCDISGERATAYAGLEAAVREAERAMAFIPASHGVLNVVLRPALAALDATAEVSDGTT